jgi:hypothetical protein
MPPSNTLCGLRLSDVTSKGLSLECTSR